MIKAIIIDVDGVLVGERVGFNFPHPHVRVLQALQKIRENNIPIILCTAKPHFAVRDVIEGAHLNNPHITDGGAVLIDPVNNIIVEELLLEKPIAKNILKTLLENNVYTEFYTKNGYFLQGSQKAQITKIHSEILQKNPIILDALAEKSTQYDITKIMPIADNPHDKEKVARILSVFEHDASISWGMHPTALPRQFGIIVNKQTSKKDAAKRVLENLSISFTDTLGIGDSTSDWKFIELCGYGATLTNGTKEIKEYIYAKGEGKYCIGKSVDENGVLDVFKKFNL